MRALHIAPSGTVIELDPLKTAAHAAIRDHVASRRPGEAAQAAPHQRPLV
jgi:hypothetical protein